MECISSEIVDGKVKKVFREGETTFELFLSLDEETLYYGDNVGPILYIPPTVKRIEENLHFEGLSIEGSLPYLNKRYKNVQSSFSSKWIRGYSLVIPSSVTYIGDFSFKENQQFNGQLDVSKVDFIGVGAFYGCSGLKSVKLPDSMEKIPRALFCACVLLENVNIPDSVKEIEDSAFYACEMLSSVSMPDTVKKFGRWAFANCTSISNVLLPESLETISEGLFCGCSRLKDFKLPSSVISIGRNAFADTAIESIDISNVKEIGKKAFSGTSIKTVIWPMAVQKIEDDMFSSSSLEKIKIPSSVTYIGTGVFSGCRSLENIDLPNSLSYIGNGAFAGTSIKNITLPPKISRISDGLFKKCENLENVYFNGIITDIGNDAFFGCGKIKTFSVPSSVIKIGNRSFSECTELVYFEIVSPKTIVEDDAFLSSGLRYINYFGIPIYDKIYYRNTYEFTNKLIESVKKKNTKIDFSLNKIELTNADECSVIFTKVIKNLGSKEISDFSKALENFNVSTFDKNISFMKSIGMSTDEIADCIIDGNYNVMSYSFEEAENNFNYLLNERVIDKKVLNKLYFDGCYSESFNDKLKEYYDINGSFPDLFRTLLVEANDSNQLELRDRLVYVATMKLLDGHYDVDNYDKAIIMLRRTLFDNVIYSDRKSLESINDDFYRLVDLKYNKMAGMILPFYNKLNGIDEKWFSKVYREMKRGGSDTPFDKFYNSLTVVNNWEQYDSRLEAITLLKNEMIGRLLYADIVLTLDGTNTRPENYYSEYIEKKKQMALTGTSIDMSTLLEFAAKPRKELFENNGAINAMLKIDGYSFDALRVGPNEKDTLSKKDIQVKYAGVAKVNGYVFDEVEVAFYKGFRNYTEFASGNKVDNYVEYINNVVGVAKIPNEDKEGYLANVRSMVKKYVSEKSDEDLFKFCRSLDLYLRNNSTYERQSSEAVSAAKEVFDTDSNISNDARIMYCLYNLNRLAHDTLELNCKAALKSKFRLAISDTTSYEDMRKVFNAYNSLYRCGLDSDVVDVLLDKSRGVASAIFRDDSSMSETVKNVNDDMLANMLNMFRKKEIRAADISREEISKIRDKLKVISDLSAEDKELIGLSIKEQDVFFECKKLFSEEVMQKLAKNISPEIKSVMSADITEKRKFYAEHGFIAEVQLDAHGNEVLVCLCSAFNNPFSVHLKDLPRNIRKQLGNNVCTPTIAHCTLDCSGLTLRDADFDADVTTISNADNFVGFRSGPNNLMQAIRSNYDNYDVPARAIRHGSSLNAGSELESMFNEFSSSTDSVVIHSGEKK